jgi:hypothetical protein
VLLNKRRSIPNEANKFRFQFSQLVAQIPGLSVRQDVNRAFFISGNLLELQGVANA